MIEVRLYYAGGGFDKKISHEKALAMEAKGEFRSVSRDATGHIRKAIRAKLLASEGQTTYTLSSLSGTKYSYQEQLETGGRAWSLMDSGKLAKHAICTAPPVVTSPRASDPRWLDPFMEYDQPRTA